MGQSDRDITEILTSDSEVENSDPGAMDSDGSSISEYSGSFANPSGGVKLARTKDKGKGKAAVRPTVPVPTNAEQSESDGSDIQIIAGGTTVTTSSHYALMP